MQRIKSFLVRHKKPLLWSLGGLVGLVIIIQIIYPANQLVPFLEVDTVDVGGMSKEEATRQLDERYKNQPIHLVLNDQTAATATLYSPELGITTTNTQRIEQLDYPLLWRLVPTSLLWYHRLTPPGQPQRQQNQAKAQEFIAEQFGTDCRIKPENAMIKASGDSLEVVEARDGGECKLEEVRSGVAALQPRPGQRTELRVQVAITKPPVTTETAKQLVAQLEEHTASSVELKVAKEGQTIAKKDLFAWLSFAAKKDKLVPSLEGKEASSYLAKSVTPKVARPAGKTVITTRDFSVLSEKKGKSGVTLDQARTLDSLLDVMLGEKDEAAAHTKTLKPSVTYQRSYTKTSTGIAAMLQHYADDHPGTYGISFAELGGGKRAQYNATKSFITASTYKLFVAYGTLVKVEKGDWKWGDQVTGGRTLSTCFDDMIVKSDNACAEALYKKIGYQKVINDVRKLGLSGTTLASDGQRTTAGDLTLFLEKLQGGSIGLKSSSRDRLLSAMKRNVYRSGIPAGASGSVADKVGFLNGLLHDAAIVYSPKGDYALTVMSDGSSWANIAEITRKIEALR